MNEVFRRRRLPHWDVPGAIYFVTSCLAGSIPAKGLVDIEQYQRSLGRRTRPLDVTETDWRIRCWKLCFARRDSWLDVNPAVRHFDDHRLASIIQDSILHFAGQRYDLFAYVIMPSHIHWAFRPLDSWVAGLGKEPAQRTPREQIMHSLKGFTGRRCNEILGAHGAFWQDESYDHVVRDLDELERIIDYIEHNPVKAGLVPATEQWQFSSAAYRRIRNLPFGQPLLL